MTVTASDIVAAARGWVGVPWHHQGRSRLGVDCVGLIECVLAETAGLPVGYRSPRNYGRIAVNDRLLEHLDQWCQVIDSPVPGSIVAIRFKANRPGHVGIVTGDTMIHAFNTVARVVEQPYREPWLRRTSAVWAFPGVSYG